MPKFTTDGVKFFEVSREDLEKFSHSLLSVINKWHGGEVAIGLDNLTERELEELVNAYSATSREEFDKVAKKIELKAVSNAF